MQKTVTYLNKETDMALLIYIVLICITVFAFKKKMWVLAVFCCLLMLLGLIAFGHLLMFADGFGSKIPITEAS